MGKSYSLKATHDYIDAMGRANDIAFDFGACFVVGSIRRRCDRVGDIDLLTTDKEDFNRLKKLIDDIEDPNAKVLVKGPTKMSVYDGLYQIDLNYTDISSLGPALIHHTGSPMLNVRLRAIAKRKGWVLNQYGLFQSMSRIRLDDNTEISIFNLLEVPKYADPAKRSV